MYFSLISSKTGFFIFIPYLRRFNMKLIWYVNSSNRFPGVIVISISNLINFIMSNTKSITSSVISIFLTLSISIGVLIPTIGSVINTLSLSGILTPNIFSILSDILLETFIWSVYIKSSYVSFNSAIECPFTSLSISTVKNFIICFLVLPSSFKSEKIFSSSSFTS